jgi:hypothetical protein
VEQGAGGHEIVHVISARAIGSRVCPAAVRAVATASVQSSSLGSGNVSFAQSRVRFSADGGGTGLGGSLKAGTDGDASAVGTEVGDDGGDSETCSAVAVAFGVCEVGGGEPQLATIAEATASAASIPAALARGDWAHRLI